MSSTPSSAFATLVSASVIFFGCLQGPLHSAQKSITMGLPAARALAMAAVKNSGSFFGTGICRLWSIVILRRAGVGPRRDLSRTASSESS